MTTFVLVPGMNHGGWWYEPLAAALADRGHRGVPFTPLGLEPAGGVDPATVDLDAQIEQLLGVVRDLGEPVVLVGHSWGGMLVTAAADADPGRVAALVYLDAFVPEDGDCAWAITNDEEREWFVDGARGTGRAVPPLPFFDDRARPHPVATLLQAVRLTGAWRRVPVKHYAVALEWPFPSPMVVFSDRAAADPEFEHHVWDTRHNVLHDGPDRVLGLLVAVATQLS